MNRKQAFVYFLVGELFTVCSRLRGKENVSGGGQAALALLFLQALQRTKPPGCPGTGW